MILNKMSERLKFFDIRKIEPKLTNSELVWLLTCHFHHNCDTWSCYLNRNSHGACADVSFKLDNTFSSRGIYEESALCIEMNWFRKLTFRVFKPLLQIYCNILYKGWFLYYYLTRTKPLHNCENSDNFPFEKVFK